MKFNILQPLIWVWVTSALYLRPDLENIDRVIIPPPEHISCISIYGLETSLKNTVCSWSHPATYYMTKVKELGFNSVRIPLSIQYIVENDFAVLDSIVHHADTIGLKLVIDIHRVSNARQEENPDKGMQEYQKVSTRDDFVINVIKVLSRYVNSSSVIGLNSWNEYTGIDVNYKREWDIHFFNHIEAAFPNRFVFFTTGLMWGGILSGFTLEDQPWAYKLYYSVHKYHFSGTGNRQDWESSFGNAFPPHKIVVGEWGFRDPEDMQFGREFTDYLLDKGIYNQCFWTIAHSSDTGGLWKDDCENINWNKYEIIKKLLATS
jgi:hypothetical protein